MVADQLNVSCRNASSISLFNGIDVFYKVGLKSNCSVVSKGSDRNEKNYLKSSVARLDIF